MTVIYGQRPERVPSLQIRHESECDSWSPCSCLSDVVVAPPGANASTGEVDVKVYAFDFV